MQSPIRRLAAPAFALALTVAGLAPAKAEPLLVADLATGAVLEATEATTPWYPASLTKLMTTYVVLNAIRSGRLTRDTALIYSARAQLEPPSKMGFQVGQTVTVDDALKMLMVQSANDIAFLLAEGVSGSVEAFVADMNRTAKLIGMTNTNFVNPNGLPVRPGPDLQRTTARDMAVLATAIYRDHPQWAGLFALDAIKIGDRTIRNHNGLMARYPGADGMKTGYVCSSGFNVVATATRGGRRLITVVLGAWTPLQRSQTAIDAFERGFQATSARGALATLPQSPMAFPIDLREQRCGKAGAQVRTAARKRDELPHPWRETLLSKPAVSPSMVYASPAAGVEQVAAQPSGLDEDPPAFAAKPTSGAPVAGQAVKPGSAKVKSLKTTKDSPKAKTRKPAAAEKKGRMKIDLKPAIDARAESALKSQPGSSVYRNAQPAAGKAF